MRQKHQPRFPDTQFRLGVEPLEDRTVPAFVLPPTYAVGEDTASVGTRIYDDPSGIRARSGDPTLGAPFVTAFAASGATQFSVALGFPFNGGVRVARADVTGDGIDDLIVGTGPGTPTLVRVYDGSTHTQVFQIQPFEAAFTGGVYVTAGDLTGNGIADLIVTPDEGGGPRVQVYRGPDFAKAADFFGIDDPNFRGGARTAVGDFNGNGRGDLVVAAGFGGGPRVVVYNGTTVTGTPQKLFNDIFVFENTLRNGAFVAAGDLDGDGKADLFAAGGPGGGPRVLVLSGSELLAGRATPLANFFAGDPSTRTGVRIAVKNLDGDARADLVAGAGPGGKSRVVVYAGSDMIAGPTPSPVRQSNAFPDYSFADGVCVG
ncbi:MAG: repeat protein [Gemmataceae bacterium]|nr:repeat protein [Gemmataceae bacterium]